MDSEKQECGGRARKGGPQVPNVRGEKSSSGALPEPSHSASGLLIDPTDGFQEIVRGTAAPITEALPVPDFPEPRTTEVVEEMTAAEPEAQADDVLDSVARSPFFHQNSRAAAEKSDRQHQLKYVSRDFVSHVRAASWQRWLFASPLRLMVLSFLLLILAGTLLLALPLASQNGQWTDPLTTCFTATSAVCVTGLVLVDTATYWSSFGQVVIILLIQLGGLSLITVVASFYAMARRPLNPKILHAVQDATGSDSLSDVYQLAKQVIVLSLGMEFLGGLILAWRFSRVLPWGRALWAGIFQGISAFCNAGFDLMGTYSGPYSSLTAFSADPILLLTTGLLLTFGGLGFVVWIDLFTWRKTHKLLYHSRLVIRMTLWILAVGTLVFCLLEWTNGADQSMGTLPVWQRPLAALFQTMTLRTAGFNSISQTNLRAASKLFGLVVMYIGAAPVSTGGGMKVTTIAIVVAAMRSMIHGRRVTLLMQRKISRSVFIRAFIISALGLFTFGGVTFILALTENGSILHSSMDLLDYAYETMSALCTVGVTSVQTENVTLLGQIPLMLAMLIGRVGPLSFAIFLSRPQPEEEGQLYPEGETFVG